MPSPDDDLACAASEFDTLAELVRTSKGASRSRSRRISTPDSVPQPRTRFVQASGVQLSARSRGHPRERAGGFSARSRAGGISPETHLAASGQTPEQPRDQLRAEAALSVSELVLDAVADDLGIDVTDEEVEARAQGPGRDRRDGDRGDGPRSGDSIRETLALRAALDRAAAEVKPIPVELAAARDKLDAGQEKTWRTRTLEEQGDLCR